MTKYMILAYYHLDHKYASMLHNIMKPQKLVKPIN